MIEYTVICTECSMEIYVDEDGPWEAERLAQKVHNDTIRARKEECSGRMKVLEND